MENSKNDEEDSSKLSEDIDIAEAQRIEIEQLKKDLAYHKFMLSELKEQNSYKSTENLFESSKFTSLNWSIDLQVDLYRFAGMHCIKLDTACVFQFLSGHKITKNDIYAVEILKIDGHQRLGRWVMPMSIDLQDLVLEYPLEISKNIKPFLKCCKHHIDCYYSRREQYYQLKEFLSDARNCFLDTTLGYLQVHLHMSGIKMIDSERIYNISLYMGYDSDRAFPYKMTTELREGKMLPAEVVPYFSKYFKPFKKQSLREAFEKVISDTRFFKWTKESYDNDDCTSFTDSKHEEEEHDEEESDDLNETETSRKSYKRKDKRRNKKKNVANDLNDNMAVSERRSSGEKSLSPKKQEERSKPNRNETRAKESANVKARRKSKQIPNSTAKNVNITKYLKSKVNGTTKENSNAIEEKTTMEKLKENSEENSKERANSKEKEYAKKKENSIGKENSIEKENSKERENSIEKENSIERENLKERENSIEKENEQINKTDTMINPSDDLRNDNIEISNVVSGKTGNEVENVTLNKTTPLLKSNEQIETKLVGKSKKAKGISKSMNRKSNNLLTKSVTNGDVLKNDKELTTIPNVHRNNIISSTPISSKLETKLYTSQCSEISEISMSGITKSKKDHTIVEQNIANEKISEEDSVSSSISGDISEENGYQEAKELLKDIQNVLEKDEAIKNNRKKIKKVKKKKKGKVA